MSVTASRRVEQPHWYVLTTFDPMDAEEKLRRENLRREDCGASAFRFIVPAQLLKHRVKRELPEDDNPEATNAENPLSRNAVSQNNAIRSALRRYIFIYGKESELVLFIGNEWNKHQRNRIHFFCNLSRSRCFVPKKEMAEFVRMLADKRLSFELSSSYGDLRKGEPVRFRNHAFEGHTVYVVESRRTKTGTVVTVELDLVKNALRMKVYDVRDEDIIRMDDEHQRYARNCDLIKRNQTSLLAIMRRRINRKETEETRMDDAQTLNTIYATRFRHFDEQEKAGYRHFLVQMLLCACLMHNEEGRTEYTEQILAELSEINNLSESKAATAVRTRIHAALFIATGDPSYRAMARDFIRDRAPKSDNLKTLVKLISKREARKAILGRQVNQGQAHVSVASKRIKRTAPLKTFYTEHKSFNQ